MFCNKLLYTVVAMHKKWVFTVFFLRSIRCLVLPNRIGLSIPHELHLALLPGSGFANNTEGDLENAHYRSNKVLFMKNCYLHIKHMRRKSFSFAPCLA